MLKNFKESNKMMPYFGLLVEGAELLMGNEVSLICLSMLLAETTGLLRFRLFDFKAKRATAAGNPIASLNTGLKLKSRVCKGE